MEQIGFLFQKQSLFDAGVAALDATDAPLSAYLRATRAAWSEMLVQRRNAIEHTGWVLPQPKYRAANGGIEVIGPEIDGRRATEYVASMLDRVTCFVEEFTTHCLQRLLAQDVTVTEIPQFIRLRTNLCVRPPARTGPCTRSG